MVSQKRTPLSSFDRLRRVAARRSNNSALKSSRSAACRTGPLGRHKYPPALGEVANALHAGVGHRGPGHVQRTSQINGPAPSLDNYALEAQPARVNRGIIDAIVGSKSGQENAA